MEAYLDFYENSLEDKSIYKNQYEEIYILTKEGCKFIAKNPFQKESKEVTEEFAEFLIKIGSKDFTRFVTPMLERIAKDYFLNIERF